MLKTESNWITKVSAASVLSVAALGLVGCSETTGTEAGVDVEDVQEGAEVEADAEVEEPAVADPYIGPYDQAFYDDIESLEGTEVTVSANVNEIISDTAFTIAGTDETTVDPLLIIHDGAIPELKPALTVEVTGIVHYVFDLPQVEEDMGLDLADDDFGDWDNKPYIEATSIDTSVPAEPEPTT